MKKKLFLLASVIALSTMLTSCIGIYWGDYDYKHSKNNVDIHLESDYDAYISEVAYENSNGKFIAAWDDGHDYDYRSSYNNYWQPGSYDNVSCYIPTGYRNIRITVIFKEYRSFGTPDLYYEDVELKANITNNKVLDIDLYDNGSNVSYSVKY